MRIKENTMKYGFIGMGNMGSAILYGMLKTGNFSSDDIIGFDVDRNVAQSIAEETWIRICSSCSETASESDVIILAVKPQQLPAVLKEISELQGLEKKLFLSIAAGFPITRIIYLLLEPSASVIRAMPNLNASVGEAITALCQDSPATKEQMEIARSVFSSVGEVVLLPEKHLGVFSAVAGASPAFTFMYMDALAMAGVQAGLPRSLAEKIAIQAVKGSSVNASLSEEHLDALRDRVCSPAGTTIEGVTVLEENGFKGSVMRAVRSVIEKDEKLSEQA